MTFITDEIIHQFQNYLIEEEKSNATVLKYVHDIQEFAQWLRMSEFTANKIEKNCVLAYKSKLMERCAPASVNVALV
ncbi:MAG: site-specific integrase, partial [Clostridia bacterium]|nr:site-specific integrase [Clostridia bacterium]